MPRASEPHAAAPSPQECRHRLPAPAVTCRPGTLPRGGRSRPRPAGPENRYLGGGGASHRAPQRVLTGRYTWHRPSAPASPPATCEPRGRRSAVATACRAPAPHAARLPGLVSSSAGGGRAARSAPGAWERPAEVPAAPRTAPAALSLWYHKGRGWGRSLPRFRWQNKHTKRPPQHPLARWKKAGWRARKKLALRSRSSCQARSFASLLPLISL